MTWFRPEIERMSGYAPGEQPQAGKFIKLNTNENPYPPSPAVARAVEAVLRRGLRLYPDPMATAFRERAADLLGVEKEWILCGNGSDDILTIVTRAFVGQGECLRFPFPSYTLYQSLAEIQGARHQQVPFRSDWSLDDRFLEPADDLRLVFLPNPNSPSGTLIEPEIVREAARRIPCPLLVDEAYAEFSRTHCVSLVRENERVMVSRSLSKSYALAGLRFGYIVAQPQIIRGLIKVKDSYNCDALSIAAATAAIDDQAWLAENLRRVLATRARLTSGLRELGFDVVESQANFVWCTHPAAGAFDLYERLKAEGILVRYMKYEGWGDGLRITVGGEGEIEVCLERLQSAVQQAGAGEHTHDQ